MSLASWKAKRNKRRGPKPVAVGGGANRPTNDDQEDYVPSTVVGSADDLTNVLNQWNPLSPLNPDSVVFHDEPPVSAGDDVDTPQCDPTPDTTYPTDSGSSYDSGSCDSGGSFDSGSSGGGDF